jgi:hypothetical protein
MAVHVCNDAGEVVHKFDSDAEAVRWWMDYGRPGDRLEDTDELLSEVAAQLGLDDDPPLGGSDPV